MASAFPSNPGGVFNNQAVRVKTNARITNILQYWLWIPNLSFTLSIVKEL
jgi:hypothetical protein